MRCPWIPPFMFGFGSGVPLLLCATTGALPVLCAASKTSANARGAQCSPTTSVGVAARARGQQHGVVLGVGRGGALHAVCIALGFLAPCTSVRRI